MFRLREGDCSDVRYYYDEHSTGTGTSGTTVESTGTTTRTSVVTFITKCLSPYIHMCTYSIWWFCFPITTHVLGWCLTPLSPRSLSEIDGPEREREREREKEIVLLVLLVENWEKERDRY